MTNTQTVLHLIGASWPSAYEARLYLTPDSSALGCVDWDREATCIATIRILSDAPGIADVAELADVDGDADGVSEWLDTHADELLSDGGRL